MKKEPKKILIESREQWRKWLEKNHSKKEKIFLVRYKKHTGKKTISQRDAMDEAICFGWIDTTVKRVDDEKFGVVFVRRGKNSRWSKATQSYGKRLIKEGRMSDFGLKIYKEGLKKKVIDHDFPKNPETPGDLKKALGKSKKAEKNFKNFAPSYRRIYIYWIEIAKFSETRRKRIKEVVRRSEKGLKWGQKMN
jgi:uncharacterized protein YdeI (YjbR/CyaY-like superfamily)